MEKMKTPSGEQKLKDEQAAKQAVEKSRRPVPAVSDYQEPDYSLLPKGARAKLPMIQDNSPVSATADGQADTPQTYTVKPGDSLSKILGTSDPAAIGAFMRENGLDSSTIQPGQKLTLPSGSYQASDAALGQATLNVDNTKRVALSAGYDGIDQRTGLRAGPTVDNALALGLRRPAVSSTGAYQVASTWDGTNGDGRSPVQKYLDSTNTFGLNPARAGALEYQLAPYMQDMMLGEGTGRLVGQALPYVSKAATQLFSYEVGAGAKIGASAGEQISNVRRISAMDANQPFISDKALAEGWYPPYSESAGVRTFTTATDKLDFVRLHTIADDPAGSFVVREKEIAHLNGDAEAIRTYLGLKDKPAYISDVYVPTNTRMQTGIIGSQPNFGLATNSGIQYQLLDRIPLSSYKNTRPLQ